MAGASDLPFRLLCHEMGASLQVTELISCKAIIYENKGTKELLKIHPDERPAAVQLFTSDEESIAAAIPLLDLNSFDILDINMGCPAPKVFKNGAGSALMKDPGLIENIVRTASNALKKCDCDIPVTVKIRSGIDKEHINAVECALAAEAGGAKMVSVHARTREEYYSGSANWSIIKAVKRALKVPVCGNGDIKDGESARNMFEETGCDAVMIARAALGNPWIFKEVKEYLLNGNLIEKPCEKEKRELILRHIDLMLEEKGRQRGILELRKHIAWYASGKEGSSKMRNEVNKVDDVEELIKLVKRFWNN